MIGGTVIEVVPCSGRIWVNTADKRDTCAIYIEDSPDARQIHPGDTVWWQGVHALWTPRGQTRIVDRRLKRIGYSGVERPRSRA